LLGPTWLGPFFATMLFAPIYFFKKKNKNQSSNLT
jgi:hypothetical protein